MVIAYRDTLSGLGAHYGPNREAGANPARSRHCERGRRFTMPLGEQPGKAKRLAACSAAPSESGDLPRIIDGRLSAENRKCRLDSRRTIGLLTHPVPDEPFYSVTFAARARGGIAHDPFFLRIGTAPALALVLLA